MRTQRQTFPCRTSSYHYIFHDMVCQAFLTAIGKRRCCRTNINDKVSICSKGLHCNGFFCSFSFLISRSTLSSLPVHFSAGFPAFATGTSSFSSALSGFLGSSNVIFRFPFSSCSTRYNPFGFAPDFSLLIYSSWTWCCWSVGAPPASCHHQAVLLRLYPPTGKPCRFS